MKEAKILLLIVEGSTDKTSLETGMDKLVSNLRTKFYITRGDIVGDLESKVDIKTRIRQVVGTFLMHNKLNPKDIYEIAQIVDLDGVFSPDKIISEDNTIESPKYFNNKIICKNKFKFIKTKHYRKSNLLHLISLKEATISNKILVPYSIYYMSCNLEHTLHNKRNCTEEEKIGFSKTFADNYEDPKKFEEIFNSPEIKIKGTYNESRDYVQKGANSLKRGSNFWLCINRFKN